MDPWHLRAAQTRQLDLVLQLYANADNRTYCQYGLGYRDPVPEATSYYQCSLPWLSVMARAHALPAGKIHVQCQSTHCQWYSEGSFHIDFINAALTIVQWKERPFVLRRTDRDITVFPNKYLEELRHYPATKISGVHAHIGVRRTRSGKPIALTL
jgi:hypothetical protein